MQVAARELASQLHCYPISCAGHRLQLCIKEGLDILVLTKAIAAARKLNCWPLQAQQQSYSRVGKEAGDHEDDRAIQETHSGLSHMVEFYFLHGGTPVGASLAHFCSSVRHVSDRGLDLTSSQWLLLQDL